MGRRKIEIQPITHERNRAVTFLKRKNGLFKKAYELGVLCSVDVAVIIFEDRPGHDTKLHQYCSSDIREIVQRQLRHQGEKDTKEPGDFSGAGGGKFDDNGDGDEDAMDDEDEDVPVRSKKRRSGARGSMQDADGDSDYHPPSSQRSNGSSMPTLPPPPMHSSRIESTGGVGSMLPVSNDRVSNLRETTTRSSKRQRSTLDSMDPGRRSPGSNEMMSSRAPELYLPEQTTRFGRQLRHTMPPPGPSHSFHPDPLQQPPPPNYNNNYNPMFPVSNQTSPPSGFMADFVSSSRAHPGAQSSFVRDMGPQPNAGGYGATARGRFNNEPQYDPALYSGNLGQPQRQPQPNPSSQYPAHSPMHREERVDIFDAFLEAERSRQHGLVAQRSASGGGSSGLEWPNHEGAPTPPPPRVNESLARGTGSMDVSSAPVPPQLPREPNTGENWFEMFSGQNPNTTGTSQGRSPRQGTSWERGSGGNNGMVNRDDLSTGFMPNISNTHLDSTGSHAAELQRNPSRDGDRPADGKGSGKGSRASPAQPQTGEGDAVMQAIRHAAQASVDASSAPPSSGEDGKGSPDDTTEDAPTI